ncbi:hypothetical protein FXF51_54165 [Nonomuraea sp. PA05]|uniref:hypothetical protein n=1 Tax=Nonomuraea sp. PA05 TaxID=2604466 RepID=UPI0011D3866E|nr:hypothetical protein [Nonomuraea sp. PA05]TYB51133.1 hypothetical protein FXF51_54165 [Nonomuraea sp. PA05]
MTRLREALDGIAAEAPQADLLDAAIAGHRRRRRTTAAVTVALAAATTAAVVAATGAVAALPWQPAALPAVPQQAAVPPDLPEGAVGVLSHAYRTPCTRAGDGGLDCDDMEWRVVTAAGKTYRMPQALVRTESDHDTPVALSRDGRKLAYYSRQSQAHVVRDMVTGAEVTGPRLPEEQIEIGSMLVVSDDGRYLVFDPREGTKYPGRLIDMRTGKQTTINGKYEPVAVKDGVVELVRYVRTDLWFMPVTGGGKPVRFDGRFIGFSELAPDGRTVLALNGEHVRRATPTITVLDVKTGRAVREIAVTGLSRTRGVAFPTIWRNGAEVVVRYDGGSGWEIYSVDVGTGKARLLTRHDNKTMSLVLPGAAAGV